MTSLTDRQTFRRLVAEVAAKAKARLPQAVNGRVESAAKLVLWQDVEPQDDGSILVGSASDPGKQYRLVGLTCQCQDFTRGQAPDGWWQHRIAAGIQKRVSEVLAAQVPAPMDPEMLETYPDNDPEEVPPAPVSAPPHDPPHGIDPRHIVQIQGKPFVKFAGLLELAHQRGLQSLSVEWTFNDPELSLAHAVAGFPFGTFAESGDATPANVNKKVAPHFRRVALTRAAARCLRLALGIDLVAVEELADE
jgi:hypothetical protein